MKGGIWFGMWKNMFWFDVGWLETWTFCEGSGWFPNCMRGMCPICETPICGMAVVVLMFGIEFVVFMLTLGLFLLVLVPKGFDDDAPMVKLRPCVMLNVPNGDVCNVVALWVGTPNGIVVVTWGIEPLEVIMFFPWVDEVFNVWMSNIGGNVEPSTKIFAKYH